MTFSFSPSSAAATVAADEWDSIVRGPPPIEIVVPERAREMFRGLWLFDHRRRRCPREWE